jgi:hypothetical protein
MLDYIWSFLQKHGYDFTTHLVFLGFTAWLAAYWALGRFFQGQKTAMLQKLYFEDGLIKPINRIEELFSTINSNSINLEAINHYLDNKITARELENQPGKKDLIKTTSIEFVKEFSKNIKAPNGFFFGNHLYEFFDQITPYVFGKYIKEWIEILEEDLTLTSSLMKNIALNYVDYMSPYNDIQITSNIIARNTTLVNNRIYMVLNHRILLKIMMELKIIFSELQYKNQKQIKRKLTHSKNFTQAVNYFLEKHKILFYFYKKENDSYITYAKKDNVRYEVNFITTDCGETKANIVKSNLYNQEELKSLPLNHLDRINRLALCDAKIAGENLFFYDWLRQIAKHYKANT